MIVNVFGCLIDWILSRDWMSVLLMLGLPLGLPLVIGSVATLGAIRDSQMLATEYLERGERQLNIASEDWLSEFSEVDDEVEIPRFTEALFRRARELQTNDRRTNFVIAAMLGQQGATGEATRLMREIAPPDEKGYPPAHAWLAIHALTRVGVRDQSALDRVLHDLEIAASWPGASPRVLAAYAEVLERVGRVDEALSVLGAAAKSDPDLQAPLAAMGFRHNRQQPVRQAADEAQQRFRDRIESGEAAISDYVQLSNLLLMQKRPEEALEVARDGMQLEPDSPQLRRLVSEAFRTKYAMAVAADSGASSENFLELLDAALKIDPTNPAVTEEIAKLVSQGKATSEELKAALQEKLVNGQATAMTHLLLAMGKLGRGEIKSSLPHLELAYKQAPNSPLILNNLALALAMERPEEVERSEKLIALAIRIVPNSAEYRDSQGTILKIKGDLAGAIKSYEEAIRIDDSRIKTRRSLAEAYEEYGLADLAEAQRKRIAELEDTPDEGEVK